MGLKYIIGLKEEIEELVKVYTMFEFQIYESISMLFENLNNSTEMLRESLLIAATDEMIAIGNKLGVVTIAYAKSEFPNQTYRGVDMIVEGFEEVDADFLEKMYQRYHRIPWTILETERCVVRELSLGDLDALFELYADDGMDTYTEPLYPYEEEKEFQRAYVENMYRYYGYGMWLVFEKESGKLIGRAGLEHREYNDVVELELGYLIGKKYQGKGYATEVCNAILDYAKENAGFERINTVIQDGNDVSIALSKKLGFEQKESYEMDGKIMHRFMKNFT
ncbi:MAG: GNAT family N-acetyltransferase [Agathobacter sp.]|nr:GNAT family N-acetyltransferase [Agathobacter sp.]